MMIKNNYSPREMAKLINVSVKTLQRWDKKGLLPAYRTPTDRRYYTHEQYLNYIGSSNIKKNNKSIVIYARVSNPGQKDNLDNQVTFLRQFANGRGLIVDEVIKDTGSGLNYNRKEWNKLIDRVINLEVDTIIISHKDRFMRFGYDWFERLCNKYGCKILIVNNEDLSPQEEMLQDLISIIHVFSCKIYGLRKYKKKIIEEIKHDKSLQNRN